MSDCAIEYVPVTEDRLADVAQTIAQYGMPRSMACLRRMLFNPNLKHLGDGVRGYLLRVNGQYAGIQCFYYVKMFAAQRAFIGRSGCFKAVRSDCARYWFGLQKKINHDKIHQLHIGNCHANTKSVAIDVGLLRRKQGPERCGVVSFTYTSAWARILAKMRIAIYAAIPTHPRRARFICDVIGLALFPVSWAVRLFGSRSVGTCDYNFKVDKEISDNRFAPFWNDYLRLNDGVCSARDPETLRWMFGDSIKAKKVTLLSAEKGGRVQGYVLLRKYGDCMQRIADSSPGLIKYKIIDICALRNDTRCLASLVRFALQYARKHNGGTLEYVGGAPSQGDWLDLVLTCHYELGFNTTTYKTDDDEITEALEKNVGWFFGPFDGERCFGHNGYIDL